MAKARAIGVCLVLTLLTFAMARAMLVSPAHAWTKAAPREPTIEELSPPMTCEDATATAGEASEDAHFFSAAALLTDCTGQPDGTPCDDFNPNTGGERCLGEHCIPPVFINDICPHTVRGPSRQIGGVLGWPSEFIRGTVIISGVGFQGGEIVTDGPVVMFGPSTVELPQNPGGWMSIKRDYYTGCCAPTEGQAFHFMVATPNGVATEEVSYTLGDAPACGIDLVALEVVQTVQDWNNSVPLIAGKRTFVRAHLQSGPGLGLQPIGGTLRGFSEPGHVQFPDSPRQPENPTGAIYTTADAADVRSDFNASLNFELPPSWQSGDVTLVFVPTPLPYDVPFNCNEPAQGSDTSSPCGDYPCGDCAVQVTFEPVHDFELKLYSIKTIDGGIEFEPSADDLAKSVARLQAKFPIAAIVMETGRIEAGTTFGALAGGNRSLSLSVVLENFMVMNTIRTLDALEDSQHSSCHRLYYGLMGGPERGGLSARKYPGVIGRIGCGSFNEDPRWDTMAHELSHLAGMDHAVNHDAVLGPVNTYSYGECGEYVTLGEPHFPYMFHVPYLQEKLRPLLGPMDEGINTVAYGLDVSRMKALGPDRAFELMSYCHDGPEGIWISTLTYGKIKNALAAVYGTACFPFATSGAQRQDVVLLRGMINLESDSVGWLPIQTVSNVDLPAPVPSGEYAVRLLDDVGHVVSETSFQPMMQEDVSWAESRNGSFVITVPANPAARQIVILHDGATLATRSASKHSPEVQLLFPNGGESINGDPVTIQWSASDLDGDTLTYIVQYSFDGGTTWETLAVDWIDTSYTVPREYLKAGANGLVRVMASDGFRTATDESDAVFTVTNNPPQVAILAPTQGAVFFGSEHMSLEAFALDREDGQLAGPSLQWTSDLDGELGTGTIVGLLADQLSEGTHLVSVVGTDGSGLTSSASVHVVVQRANPDLLADLIVTKEAAVPAVVAVGEPITFTLTVENRGPDAAPGSTLIDQLPPNVDVVSIVAAVGSCAALSNTINCDLGSLAAGQIGAVIVVLRPTVEGILTNTAIVVSNVTDPLPANNTAKAVVQAAAPCPFGTNCDDGTPCTIDSCNSATGCIHRPASGNPCDDDNPCTDQACDPVTGCVYSSHCDDGNLCTTDSCDAAAGCSYAPFDCDDSNSCTLDSCTPATGCLHSALDCEPNGATANATPLGGNDVVAMGNIFPVGDQDVFSFSGTAGAKVFAAVQTSFSAGSSSDSTLDLLDTNGTTVLETDTDDGSAGSTSSIIAGKPLPSTGTFFLRVRQGTANAGTIRPYYLHFRLQTVDPTPESEPNEETPNTLLASGFVSGTRGTTTDADYFTFTAAAGDTVSLILDGDPERDAIQWNPRLGIGAFGDLDDVIVAVNDGSVGSASNPLSEALFMTVKTAGTYYAYVDTGASSGGSTFTYVLSVSVHPASLIGTNCTVYTSTDVPKSIGPTAGMTNSTITIPGNPRIEDLNVSIALKQAVMADIDAALISPQGNENSLFTDIGANGTGGQFEMDIELDDAAALPAGTFAVQRPLRYQPELGYRLGWFKGELAGGTWTLRLRDDTTRGAGLGGTLTGWSITVCEPQAPAACVGTLVTAHSADFESGAQGYTHSGAQDEWERGLPSFAPITTCNSGANCWKTDLDDTYNAGSNQDLVSPNISLAGLGAPVTVSWAQRYNLKTATSDGYFAEVREPGPTNATTLFQFLDATMSDSVGSPLTTIQESAGWGLVTTNIDAYANKTIQLHWNLSSDGSAGLTGVGIDDVTVTACCTVASCNDGNPCTNETCDPAIGCVHTPNFAPCDDGNACTTNDTCGSGGCSGTPLSAPGEVDNAVRIARAGGAAVISWNLVAGTTSSQVLRGDVSALPVGPGGSDELCLGSTGTNTMTDAYVPPANSAVWYLVRGTSTCAGAGTYGKQGVHGSPGASRVSATCP